MKYENIADIYSANALVRNRFIDVVGNISDDDAAILPEGENWSIRQIVEHVSMVEFGVMRICGKLLAAAKETGKTSDGSFTLTADFSAKSADIAGRRVEAPERVQPTGEVSIAEAVERMKTTTQGIAALQTDLETCDLSDHKFPHPFFGDLTAAEWLVMLGGHEARHTHQIERVLEKVRQ